MMDKKKGRLITTVIFLGISAILVVISPPDALIMMMGIRTARKIMLLFACISGIIAGVNGVLLIKSFAKEREINGKTRKTLDIEKEVTENYAHDAGDAVNTRKRLVQIENTSPGYAALMGKCLAQMDRIDELQRRQRELITSNAAAYLKDTETTLDIVEREICLNFRGIVNQCIVAGNDGDELKLDMDKVNLALRKNNELLSQSKELLQVSADWIDEYNSKGSSDRSLLESWIKTIRNTIDKNS